MLRRTMPAKASTPVASRSLNQQLLEAAKNGDNDEVCRMVLLDDEDEGIVDVNTKDKRGYTVLHYCSNRTESRPDDGDTVRLILDRGAIVEARNHEGCTPLHYASKNGLVDTVSVLLEMGGAHANSKNVFEWTPLMYCAEHNQTKVACLLLGKGASVHTKNRAGCTSLHYASIAGHVSIIYLLLGMGADVHARRKTDGKTPLDLAKNEETARILNGSLPLRPVQTTVSSLQAALLKPQQQQQRGSSLQAALQQQQQPQGGGGGSSLQAAPRQTQQQTAVASCITVTTSKSSGTYSSTGTNVTDKRLDALVQKQEKLTVSLQDQVNRLETLLASTNNINNNNIQNDKDDTTVTLQENIKTAVVAPVKTITIQSNCKNNGTKPMSHRSKKKAPQQAQQQQDTEVPASSGRYSLTIGSKYKQQQQSKQFSKDNSSIGDADRYRTVLVPIGTNSDCATTTTTENNNSRANSTNTRNTSSPGRNFLSDFAVPSRTPPTHHQTRATLSKSYSKQHNTNHSSNTGSNNEYPHSPPPPPLDEQQKISRIKRSGLKERMKMYEKDTAAGFLRRNGEAGGQQQQHNHHVNIRDNDEKQNKRRMTNQY